MHTLARIPAREARLNRQTGNRAFTLIELLTVIGIIAILAAITFGVVKGVNERAAIGQAKTELAVLSQALEAYKKQYGDYPQTGLVAVGPNTTTALAATHTQALLFNALAGKLGPKLGSAAEITNSAINSKSFVELSRFSLETTTLPSVNNATAALNSFLDPWGRRYMYYYNSAAAGWRHPGYILFSVGPNADYQAPTNTVNNYTHANNLDSIYANKN
ncbi:prepilin-type N-terminal cleavage/methylation domain-containing protein [Rariglobus hedericola]|uniref:Prepilin-type N-terminal cleavage/methylation domain-containing protein n=1 Tax=Rariglobus hedericola TaxID=2597822 RepID=A0A556QMK6_9BACT|nr:prepilin-type N-terminal cleavage/methylation domain-containing protein [Rariglobus hedericola]TSJ77857.1 prepilin-type N-terminal cleavage/methylation domain-containing protein [Rariglobus hedericola]